MIEDDSDYTLSRRQRLQSDKQNAYCSTLYRENSCSGHDKTTFLGQEDSDHSILSILTRQWHRLKQKIDYSSERNECDDHLCDVFQILYCPYWNQKQHIEMFACTNVDTS